jgi:penicillin-binding protein 2
MRLNQRNCERLLFQPLESHWFGEAGLGRPETSKLVVILLMQFSSLRLLALLGCLILLPSFTLAATTQSKKAAGRKVTAKKAPTKKVSAKSTATKRKAAPKARTTRSRATTARARRAAPTTRRRTAYSPWTTPTYADSTTGDNIDGEDLAVRQAAVAALGPFNGSVVVADPNTGRLLTVVNQKLAFGRGYQPCSTIKVPVALAALREGVIEKDTKLRLYGRTQMGLSEALARSNNPYFAILGERLGFEKVSYYSKQFGLGEKAGLGIPEESPGAFPARELPAAAGGVGRMTSFGQGIPLTPLQLTAFLGSLANGGTLYYLQHPRSHEEVDSFVPRVKRHLDIAIHIDDLKEGMAGAIEYGTARRVSYSYNEPVMGKTGTCTEARTHLGWFGSFNSVGDNSLVVVVMLTGAEGVSGPTASGIAGRVYQNLSRDSYFTRTNLYSPAALISAPLRGR